MSFWSVAVSLFFSISLFGSAYQAAQSSPLLAGAGNPQAVQQGLTTFMSRMGGSGAEMPAPVAQVTGTAVSFSRAAPAERLSRIIDYALAKGKPRNLEPVLVSNLGLGDGTVAFPITRKGWKDDNDGTIHIFDVSASHQEIIITWEPADQSQSIAWRTDPSAKLMVTVLTDASGSRVVPNATYSARFAKELPYWDALVPASPAGVASTATGTN